MSAKTASPPKATPSSPRKRPPARRRPWGWVVLLVVFSMLSAVAGAFSAMGLRDAGLLPEEGPPPLAEIPQILAGVGITRTNILILGSDVARGGPARSDTMLVASLDPDQGRITLVSIPRDTRVRIPGRYGADKINAAFAYGGAELASQTVSDFLGVPIHHWIRLKLDGLVKLVDVLGGVNIYVDKNMHYRDRAGGLRIAIKKGWHLMDGTTAHQYVRFRHDSLGDIGRVQRQQQFMRAVGEQLLNPASLTRLPQIIGAAQDNIETDMTGTQILRYASWAKGVDRSNIKMVMIPGQFSGGRYAASYWLADPQDVRRIGRMLSDAPAPQTAEPDAEIKRQTRITVLNGTKSAGLASEAARLLRSAGWTVWVVSSADRKDHSTTQIIVQRGDDALASSIGRSLGVDAEAIAASVGDVQTDFTVILGQDFLDALRHPRVVARGD